MKVYNKERVALRKGAVYFLPSLKKRLCTFVWWLALETSSPVSIGVSRHP
ncbi:hypothetical protein ASN18_2981 [Candidatus Magnetominusculus xianensis]|uniref:Uncharacterized protein n=1 Tax=Candidatus Magnetominusculus xianensis TaxID=1748249 RepID=A0ABR5SD57_9BACT|nr:hypothetical protein ASN18_2981 [Candidatus Magnetominusculus xianensis]